MAAVLACGPGAVLSHRTAAQIWGLLPPASTSPEVTRRTKFRPRPGIVCRRAIIPSDERDVVNELPVTSVHRTIFDLAGMSGGNPARSKREVERAMREAEVRRLTDRLSIPDLPPC